MLETDMGEPHQHTEDELEAAFSAGINAAYDNQPLSTNPYPLNSILWQ